MAPRGNSRRTKSRKRGGRKVLCSQTFRGNRYTKQQEEDTDGNTTEQPQPSDNYEGDANDGPTLNLSATARTLNTSFSEARGENTDGVDVVSSHYILIDSDIMGQIVNCIAHKKIAKEKLISLTLSRKNMDLAANCNLTVVYVIGVDAFIRVKSYLQTRGVVYHMTLMLELWQRFERLEKDTQPLKLCVVT